ncbi:MAG: YicC family protein, partial [Halieaceae bacterium]|nr:YicC family protein [Halieaceae bacterium]
SLECKSVNSRFLDLTLKLPDVIKRSEPALRQLVSEKLVRGKVELSVRLDRSEGGPEAILNLTKLNDMKDALATVVQHIPNAGTPSSLDVLMTPGVWVSATVDSDEIIDACLNTMPELMASLSRHRQIEGDRLETLLRERCQGIQRIVLNYREQLPALQAAQQQKLRDRINAIDVPHDEKRLEEELAILANKSDVAEELDRLDAHTAAIDDALCSGQPCGRRLDFVMQELNREANTLGSKTTSLVTTNAAVELKVLIEQMREQVQNLE